MMAAVDRAGPRVAQRLDQVPHWFALWEQRLSRFQPDSELSQINLSTGSDIGISSVMQEVLHSALRASRVSDGMVTPTILNALETSGYERSFEEISEEVPENGRRAVEKAADVTAIQAVELNTHARTVRLAPGTRLDLGGIAKGWAADRAAHHLRRLGPALVNAGGDIAITAPMQDRLAEAGIIPTLLNAQPSDPFTRQAMLAFQGGIAYPAEFDDTIRQVYFTALDGAVAGVMDQGMDPKAALKAAFEAIQKRLSEIRSGSQ